MDIKPKLAPRHYYVAAEPQHNTGDIWMNLPTLGLTKSPTCSGIIITPACDLANNKVETVTYLPIIPIGNWFATRAFYNEVRNNLLGFFRQLNYQNGGVYLSQNNLPVHETIEILNNEIIQLKVGKSIKELELINRCIKGIQILKSITDQSCNCLEKGFLQEFLGIKNYDALRKNIIGNAYRSDLHFLPYDNQDIEWSAVPKHSVILFRYPLTAPIEIFDLANDIACIDWDAAVSEISRAHPFSKHFLSKRPLKTIKLKTDFLSDMLTRFVGMYVRLGSPDFSNETIAEIAEEIGEEL